MALIAAVVCECECTNGREPCYECKESITGRAYLVLIKGDYLYPRLLCEKCKKIEDDLLSN